MIEHTAVSVPGRQGKHEIRSAAAARRNALSADERRAASARIVERIQESEMFRCASAVMAYSSICGEVDTAALLDAILACGKCLVLPRADAVRVALSAHVVKDPARELRPGAWGIREPDPDRCLLVDLADVDLVVVPGVAFDAKGGRIGYGKGFYDRFLAGVVRWARSAQIVAPAFEAQIVGYVPTDGHDITLDAVVTERRWITCVNRA